MYKFGVMDINKNKVIATYTAEYIDKVKFQQPHLKHFKIKPGRPESAFFWNEDHVEFDFSYEKSAETKKRESRVRLLKIKDFFKELVVDYASENSVILRESNLTQEEKDSLVNEAASAIKPISDDIDNFNINVVWDKIDNITRSGILLTEERISVFKGKFQEFINNL